MLKRSFFFILRYSGLRFLFWKAFQRKGITVLMYHDIDYNSFEKHIKYLASRYSIISMNDFLKQRKGEMTLPEYSVVLTFDDGHKRNYELLPLIKRYNIPVTIFLCSGIIDTNRRYWFLNQLDDLVIQGLKKLQNDERLGELAGLGYTEKKEYTERQALNKMEIEEMKSAVNFQSHTVFHPILPNCTDKDSEQEIALSKRQLEMKYGFEINAFAYPNGDYTSREIDFLKSAGYKAAFTTKKGYNSLKTNNHELQRFDSNDAQDINEFAVRSSGLWEYLKDPKSILSLF
ncbi:polysaccharide deacetylase family protein [Croceivirga thetidis]|uniref:Polysaccharide deacetylase family protein n=1 Tax=Croceivirga thetidis TaxID=2721623 RepID=A0ABX1GTK2_9FLAO|nr:polysaccharide deacetylase family protein [Croceivirga thetidis]NKI32052.1 polysaccharide deacetylase family protein [Croceivirga thetidis]